MGIQLLVNPYPDGTDQMVRSQVISGSAALFGSAAAAGEPVNWNKLITGIGYNEVNFKGNGIHGQNTALTTGFAVAASVATVTAANNFFPGQQVTFAGNVGTLSALFNNQPPVTILTATSSQFTFATANTGTTTTGDVGLAVVVGENFFPLSIAPPTLTVTVTALSASGTTLTVTAANNFLPGAQVAINVATGTLGPKLAGQYVTVILSTGTAFTATMLSALTGTTGTGTAVGANPPQPYSVEFWLANGLGYIYTYQESTGVLLVQQVPSSASLSSAAPMGNLPAAAYPAGVLGDVIKYEAYFSKM